MNDWVCEKKSKRYTLAFINPFTHLKNKNQFLCFRHNVTHLNAFRKTGSTRFDEGTLAVPVCSMDKRLQSIRHMCTVLGNGSEKQKPRFSILHVKYYMPSKQ